MPLTKRTPNCARQMHPSNLGCNRCHDKSFDRKNVQTIKKKAGCRCMAGCFTRRCTCVKNKMPCTVNCFCFDCKNITIKVEEQPIKEEENITYAS